eukprot:gene30319-44207_t
MARLRAVAALCAVVRCAPSHWCVGAAPPPPGPRPLPPPRARWAWGSKDTAVAVACVALCAGVLV